MLAVVEAVADPLQGAGADQVRLVPPRSSRIGLMYSAGTGCISLSCSSAASSGGRALASSDAAFSGTPATALKNLS